MLLWVPACLPEQQLWLVFPSWQQVKLLLSLLLCMSASSEFWLLMDSSKRERKLPHSSLTPSKSGFESKRRIFVVELSEQRSCWARVSFSSYPSGWRSCSENELELTKKGAAQRGRAAMARSSNSHPPRSHILSASNSALSLTFHSTGPRNKFQRWKLYLLSQLGLVSSVSQKGVVSS